MPQAQRDYQEMLLKQNDKWYRAGLHFECEQCGNCCGGFPGYVWVTADEMARIAEHLGVTLDDLEAKYVRRVGRRRSLNEKSNYDCVFLERGDDRRGQCMIYSVRPQQCRTWPFWKRNVTSANAWNGQARRCPGINRGERYTYEQIEDIVKRSPC